MIFKKPVLYFILMLLVFNIFQSCKVYQKPITINEAISDTSAAYLKVNYKNGDELIFKHLERENKELVGVHFVKHQEIKTILKEDEILNIEKHNKSSSTAYAAFGIALGIGSILLGVGMF